MISSTFAGYDSRKRTGLTTFPVLRMRRIKKITEHHVCRVSHLLLDELKSQSARLSNDFIVIDKVGDAESPQSLFP